MDTDVKNIKFWIKNECKVCSVKYWSRIKQKSLFCSNKCSSKFTSNDTSRLLKIKETKLKKYGDENYVNSNKAKLTNLKKYGFDNPSKSECVKTKIKQTNLSRHGVDHVWQSEIVKQKIKTTNLKKYGVEHVSSNADVKNKVRSTCNKKYGTDNVFKSNWCKEKIKSTNIDKYGVNHFSKTDIFKNKIKKHHIEFFIENIDFHKLNLNYIPLFGKDDYINTNKNNKYKFQCKKCDCIFEDHIDGGHLPRCLQCFPINVGSINQTDIYNYIKGILPNERVLQNCMGIIKTKELDIYLPDKKIAIEFNGLYWHSELNGKKDKSYHLNKLLECEDRDITLIQIFEDEWVNKQDIIKNRLCSILNCNTHSVYARNCITKIISFKDANGFLKNTHSQPSIKSKINIGLYNNDVLVSVMSFGKERLSNGIKLKSDNFNTYELYRFASIGNITGGFSKMLSFFKKLYVPDKIVSYADRRYSRGNVYEKNGFVLTSKTPVNYWYFKPGYYIRHHRFGYRKDQLHKKLNVFDPSLTEWENMKLNGYDRIWDCGNLKYEMSFV